MDFFFFGTAVVFAGSGLLGVGSLALRALRARGGAVVVDPLGSPGTALGVGLPESFDDCGKKDDLVVT